MCHLSYTQWDVYLQNYIHHMFTIQVSVVTQCVFPLFWLKHSFFELTSGCCLFVRSCSCCWISHRHSSCSLDSFTSRRTLSPSSPAFLTWHSDKNPLLTLTDSLYYLLSKSWLKNIRNCLTVCLQWISQCPKSIMVSIRVLRNHKTTESKYIAYSVHEVSRVISTNNHQNEVTFFMLVHMGSNIELVWNFQYVQQQHSS